MVLATINYKVGDEYAKTFNFKLKSVNDRIICTIYSSIYNPADVLKLQKDYNLEFDTIQLVRKMSSVYSLNSVKADAAMFANQTIDSKILATKPTQTQPHEDIFIPVSYNAYNTQPNSLFAFANSQLDPNLPNTPTYPSRPTQTSIYDSVYNAISSTNASSNASSPQPRSLPNQTKPALSGPSVQKLNSYVQQLIIHIKENSNGVPDFSSVTVKNISKSKNFIKSVLNVNLSEEEYQYVISKIK